MNKLVYFIISLLTLSFFAGCKYDDSDLWSELEKQKEAIIKMETVCSQMNANISSLKTIINVLYEDDCVTSLTPVILNDVKTCYSISFVKSNPISIYNLNEEACGNVPMIGLQQDSNGIYYWTIDGEWLINGIGDKIEVITKNGNDEKSNITPMLKIDNNYWHISYDNGTTWVKLDEVIYDTEVNGNSYFTNIDDDNKNVYIKLHNGTELIIKKYIRKAELLSLIFKASQNPSVLIEDLEATITDNICECLIPHMVSKKNLIPVFDTPEDCTVWVDDTQIISGNTELDFSKPVIFKVVNSNDETVSYVVNVRAFTGLPIITINTENGQNVTSRDVYLNANIKIIEDITTRASGDVFESSVKIKGRGNTTWYGEKKPYKLKFNEKVSLFGEPKDKEWVLLANHFDHTLIRTDIAMYMGKRSNLAYTTSTHFAELFINNVYLGTYQVAEQQKISTGRVNVTDEGFLIEVDAKADASDITFRIGSIPQPLNIKDPEVEVNSDHYNYIVNFMEQVETALYSENWLDIDNGWQKYMDIDSFVDWYLINEITRNNDAVFFSSCYMNYTPGGKLCMGPLWDFDLAFGNYTGNSSPIGFYIKEHTGWYARLFNDPAFKKRVRERFEYFYSIKEEILNEMNISAKYLELSAIENNNKWNIFYKSHYLGNVVLGAYYNEVNYMKQWFIDRMEWLKVAYENL